MTRTSSFLCSLAAIQVILAPAYSQERASDTAASAPSVEFPQVAALLSKYCAGCHNDGEMEGDFSVSSYASLMAGTDEGPVIVAREPQRSKLLQMVAGEMEPVMPPEDEPRPSADEIDLLRRWIEQGAQNRAEPHSTSLSIHPPKLPAASPQYHHVGAACGVDGQSYAVGLMGEVELRENASSDPRWTVQGLTGKVNALRLSPDRSTLIVGCGIAGIGGEALLLSVSDGRLLQRVTGHRDAIYCAALSPDGNTLATGSYDRSVILWDASTGEKIRELTGHNGAIYDVDFDPSGELLATASADQTVKLWRIDSGQRLDTLGQPEGEQRCVRFSPDGQTLVAAGSDKQIRKWRVASRTQPAINPLLLARYAHEADILQLAYSPTGELLSASADLSVKHWRGDSIQGLGTLATLTDVPVGLCLAPIGAGDSSAIQLDGRRVTWPSLGQRDDSSLSASNSTTASPTTTSSTTTSTAWSPGVPAAHATPFTAPGSRPVERPPRPASAAIHAGVSQIDSGVKTERHEAEPNDTPLQATPVELPSVLVGNIAAPNAGREDQDLWRFHSQAGQTWIIEVAAARQGSSLDSRIDVLDASGQPVVRTRLQATRESYFTFRGKDSTTSDDFRLHKWEDMELDEYLYANGEVNRLWLYPRGPDSGFKVYPGSGKRHAFFDTTPLAHALGQPTYIVRELAPGETPLPNGLPIFPVLFENDDDAQTRLGKDSRLSFIAPEQGDFLLRIRDARGFGGNDFNYQVTIRAPQPDFQLEFADTEFSVPPGSGREWSVNATRVDGLDGPIAIELEDIPAGVMATNPVIIEAGQQAAVGAVFVTDAVREQLGDQQQFEVQLTAWTRAGDRQIKRRLKEKLKVTLSDQPEVQLRLVAADDPSREIEELTIRPGETVSARVMIERGGTTSRIELGKEDSGRNLPHGAFVDNIGLNGLLIPEGQSEREFFITAAPKVAPGRRQFHLKSATPGKPTSRPVWLNVLPPTGD